MICALADFMNKNVGEIKMRNLLLWTSRYFQD